MKYPLRGTTLIYIRGTQISKSLRCHFKI